MVRPFLTGSAEPKTCRRQPAPTRLVLETLEERTLLSSDPLTGGGGAPVPAETVQVLQPLSITGNTADAQQSKLWRHDNAWWAVMSDSGTVGTAGSGGTFLWRLDGTTWTQALRLTSAKYRADVREVGDVTHVMLFGGDQDRLVSLEYVPPASGAPGTYQLWTQRPKSSLITLAPAAPAGTPSVVGSATIDVDCQGRMWLASDGADDIEVRYSDAPYTTWSQPIVLASGVGAQDTAVVTALPNCQVGVLWSNQIAQRFGFRLHADAADSANWSADEVPASQSAQKDGAGMAAGHMNLAVAPDGTLYAAVKTGYKNPNLPAIGLLVRRPSGTWDPMVDVDHVGLRPVVVLNDNLGRLLVAYTATDVPGYIVYKESSTFSMGFGDKKTLLAGTFNDATSTKQNWSDSLVILASGSGSVAGAMVSSGATNHAPLVNAGVDQRVSISDAAVLDGTVQDDGLPNPPGQVTTRWSQVSGPGTVTFADATAADTMATFSAVGTYVLRLDAGDGLLSAGDEATITVTPPPNKPPVVEIRTDPTILLTDTAKLHGLVRDDGLPNPPGKVNTGWLKTSGPGDVTFTDPFARDTTATFSDPGTYVLWFGASDGELSASAETTIEVTDPPNQPPQVDAGADQTVLVSKPTDLPGNVRDDGLPRLPGKVTSMWIKMSGPGPVSFRNASAPHTTATFGTEGTYVLRLEADDGNLSASDEVTINVAAPVNQPPVVDAGPDQTVSVTKPANLNGTANDDGLPKLPGKVTNKWSKVSGPGTVTFQDPTAARTTAIFSVDGTYVLRLDASDGVLSAGDELTITITPPPANLPPQVDAGADQMVAVAKPVTLNGAVQDDGLPKPAKLTSTWTKVSGPGNVVFAKAASPKTTATFSMPGTYVLRLDASDGAARSGDEMTVTVVPAGVNLPPQADAGLDQSVVVLKPATLNGTARDDGLPKPPGKLTTTWTKVSGPGTVTFRAATAARTSAIFSAEGTYVLRLQANDGSLAASDDVTITVTPAPANQAPQVNAGADQAGTALKPVSLSGTVRDDGLPTPAKVATTWTKVSGPGTATIAKPALLKTTATFDTPGDYVLRLTANDGALTAGDDIVITVAPPPPNQAPQVNAGVDQELVATMATTLHGTVRDDGLPVLPAKLTTTWTAVSGPGTVSFAKPTVASTGVTFSDPGVYVLLLQANDGELSASDDVAIIVTAATNLPPVVNAGPDLTVLLSTSPALHGTVQDDGLPMPPGKVTTAWSLVSGPGKVSFKNSAAADTTAKFSVAGTYVLRLTADDGLIRTTDDVLVNVVTALPIAAMLGVRSGSNSHTVDVLLAARDLTDLLFSV